MKTLGDRLKQLRESENLKQTELVDIFAKRNFNITSAAISQYESNKRTPDTDTLAMYADFFNVTLDWLYGRTDNKNPYEIETIAAHHDGDEWTEEELNEIEKFKEFIKMKREQRKG